MAFSSSSINFDTSVVPKNGSVVVSFDISFDDNTTTSMTIDYVIVNATCAVFAANGQTTLSHSRSGMHQHNNIFTETLKFSGDCTDSFQLQVNCTISDDNLPASEAISYNAVTAMAMSLHPTAHQALMQQVQIQIKASLDKHVKDFHQAPTARSKSKK